MGTISRAEMQSAIAAGGVVLHDGRIYNDPNLLPTEAELAKGDPAKEEKAREDLQAQIDALKSQLAVLTVRSPAPKPSPVPQPAATSHDLPLQPLASSVPAATKVTEANAPTVVKDLPKPEKK